MVEILLKGNLKAIEKAINDKIAEGYSLHTFQAVPRKSDNCDLAFSSANFVAVMEKKSISID